MINMLRALLVAIGLWVPTQASATVPCTLPFTFSNGQIADATQVNANYNQIVLCLQNAAAAGVNFDITTLTGLTTPLSVSQGGTGTNTHTANAILFGNGSGAIGSSRCIMDSNLNIQCQASGSFFPQFTGQNTTSDVNASYYIFKKSRSGGNTNSGDSLGTVLWQGFANSAFNNSAQLNCFQSGASVGSNIPTRCVMNTSTAGGQLNIGFGFPTANGATGQQLITDGGGNASWSNTYPTVQYLTAVGTNTYTTPAGARKIIIEMCGAGGGGGASNTNAGAGGGNTTFDGVVAVGGGGGGQGSVGANTATGGGGGTGGGGAADFRIRGSEGQAAGPIPTVNAWAPGGDGGPGYHGAGRGRGGNQSSGSAGAANSCAGGGGAGGPNNNSSGAGGGAGELVFMNRTPPAGTYSYTINNGGNGGAAGNVAGSNGGSGLIVVTEYYHHMLRCQAANDNEPIDWDSCKAA